MISNSKGSKSKQNNEEHGAHAGLLHSNNIMSTEWPTTSEQRALAYAPKPFALLSFLSSLFVMYYLLIRHPEKRKRMYHRLMLSTFGCFLPLSFAIFWGTWVRAIANIDVMPLWASEYIIMNRACEYQLSIAASKFTTSTGHASRIGSMGSRRYRDITNLFNPGIYHNCILPGIPVLLCLVQCLCL